MPSPIEIKKTGFQSGAANTWQEKTPPQECYRMSEIANARINTFGSKPPKADFVPPDDPTLEIPLSELQALFNSSVALFNDILDIAREERLIDKKDSAELLINAQNTIKKEKSPIE